MSTFETVDLAIPELIHAEQIIIASNRGPFEYCLSQDKTLEYNQGPGGLVMALTVAANFLGATWIAMAMTEGDRLALRIAQQENNGILQSQVCDQRMKLRYVAITEDAFRKHYEKISNEYDGDISNAL